MIFSDFICTFATSLMILLVVKRITKVIEKSDMAKSWALGFAACNKQELFVAQELINNVKLKCCGIYVNEENCVFIFGMCVCCYGSCTGVSE
ncbi:MAG: hypothetical protein MSA28_02780 [Prevotella sp.]|nr:hypothetical protein [Prevotella sp.]